MAIALVNEQQFTFAASGTTSVCSGITATQAGDCIVLVIGQSAASTGIDISSITDDVGTGTWVFTGAHSPVTDGPPPVDWQSGTNSMVTIAYMLNAPAGITSITITWAASKKANAVLFSEWSGVATASALSDSIHGGGGTATTTPAQTTKLTTGGNGLFVGGIAAVTASSVVPVISQTAASPSSGWTGLTGAAPTSTFAVGGGWQAFASDGTRGASWTIGASSKAGMVGIYLIAAAGATTFNQSLPASVSISASVVKGANKLISAPVTATASITKLASKAMSAPVAATAAIQKVANKALKATVRALARRLPTLSTSGTPTFTSGRCTIDSGDRIWTTEKLLDETQGWVAARVRMGAASGSDPHGGGSGNNLIVFEWASASNNRIRLSYQPFNNVPHPDEWRVDRNGLNTTFGILGGTQSFAAGDDFTVIFAWDATHVYLSVNGGAFVSAANTTIPDLSGTTTFEIGSGGSVEANKEFDGDIHWLAAGRGTLTDADAAALDAFGNSDPDFGGIPSPSTSVPTLSWDAAGTQFAAATMSTGAVFSRALSASITLAASVSKGVQKRMAASVTASASVLKSIGKALSASVTATASVRKVANKALSAPITATAKIVKLANKALSAAVSLAASIGRTLITGGTVFPKAIAATVTATASMKRLTSKSLQSSVTATASIKRAISTKLSASVTATASMLRGAAFFKTLTAPVTVTASILKGKVFKKVIQAPVTATASIGRRLKRGLILTPIGQTILSLIEAVKRFP